MMAAWPVHAKGTMVKEFDVESGQELIVDLETGGSLDIRGWDKKKVEVTVIYRDRADYVDIEIERTKSGVQIESSLAGGRGWPKSFDSPDFEIRVPMKFDLDLHTMGGEIRVEDVEGSIEGLTMGGELNLTRLKGEIALKTMGGDITCRDSDLDGYVNTMGGEVLMENLVGDVKGSSMGGQVIYRNVTSRDGSTTGDVVNIHTMGGDISVNVAPEGAKVHTMGGDIHIRSARKFVRAKTMGGDVRIDEIDGSVSVTTMAGDIEVVMVGDPDKGERDVSLTSMSGDIDLTVPAELSMELYIELAYTRGHEGEFDIISDFDLKKERTDKWDEENGSPRKHIYATGSIKGGKHRIRIKTINGHIYLNKGK